MPRRILKVIGVALLLVGLLSLVWLVVQPRPSIVLVQDSRQTLGAGSAFFSITNPTQRAAFVILSEDSPLITNGLISPFFRVEEKLRSGWTTERARPDKYAGIHVLEPGQSVAFKAELSTNQAPQRIVIFWQFENKVWRPRSRTLPIWFTKARELHFKIFGTSYRTLTSEEISANSPLKNRSFSRNAATTIFCGRLGTLAVSATTNPNPGSARFW